MNGSLSYRTTSPSPSSSSRPSSTRSSPSPPLSRTPSASSSSSSSSPNINLAGRQLRYAVICLPGLSKTGISPLDMPPPPYTVRDEGVSIPNFSRDMFGEHNYGEGLSENGHGMATGAGANIWPTHRTINPTGENPWPQSQPRSGTKVWSQTQSQGSNNRSIWPTANKSSSGLWPEGNSTRNIWPSAQN